LNRNVNAFTVPPQSYWAASTGSTDYPALEEDIKVDVAIVGGGLVGVTAAYLLKQENISVAIIEADRIGQGTTGHTTAKITSQHSLIYDKLIKHLGREKSRQYAEANEYAITFIEKLVKKNKIDCDFSRQAAYVYTQSDQYIKQIEDEVKAAAGLGIKAHYLEQIPLPFGVKAAERFDNQAQFHPRKYLLALAKDIAGGGGHIFEQTRAVDFHEGAPFAIITASGHKVTAERMIIASHFPAYGGSGYYFARIYPDRSYALAVTAEEKFPGGMYITAESPGRSLRSAPYNDGELIIAAGEHHKTGQGPPTENHYRNLAQFAEQTFTVTGIPFRWSTQDYTTLDEVPYVGRLTSKSPNVYVATGFRKWGMTNGTAAAILLKDLIVHGKSPWEAVYDPARFEADPMIKKFVTANIDVVKQMGAGKLKSAPRETEPAPGEAVVVAGEEGKVGLYKDNKGRVHAVDITCPHMGCELAWNEAELSWDCPCHGSRFTYEGDIIEGPALKSLRAGGDRFNP
jgi:glycine/D-amino acid oxidase-like deaminating enzyme/nitrite reductase/ring-hydroxylating ferredoxin subunit